ncbi:Type 2A phosphatase activator TIP41 [Candida viswanathii]|uniref:Type 2A phosphatase activator TIP41 n=1 Tax=Candida viswanathii TaxID=5486 RepID=A0A367YGS7_9ASCO|nr:Type 2A phosphatase activator TIP41 [Candida viswanathii]
MSDQEKAQEQAKSTSNEKLKEPPQQPQPSVFAIPSSRRGINAVHVNAAREMVKLHTQGRNPPAARQTRGGGGGPTGIPSTSASSSLPITSAPPSTTSTFPSSSATPFPKVSIPLHHDETECKNPQCAHCGQIIIPSPQSSFPIQDKPSITVNSWSIYTTKKPILNSAELDSLTARFEFPLPEMIFGNSSVRIVDDDRGGSVEFNALDSLDTLEDECEFKVSYHEEWIKSRRSKQSAIKQEQGVKKDLTEFTDNLDGLKPYDWTYSTNFRGNVKGLELVRDETREIPIEKLTRPDPILFYDESILFEDELADNGISILSYKIRVMPSCLLLLCRFFLRIDNVTFRIRDTRIFIDFDTNEVIREYKVQQDQYDNVLKKVNKTMNEKDPKKLLRDPNWVSMNLPVILREVDVSK